MLFFPISYLFGDILTEVYGYARSRRVVWAGFAALAFAALMSRVVLEMPADPSWPNQKAWETVFGNAPRVVLASMLGFFSGEFANSYTLAKLKIMTAGPLALDADDRLDGGGRGRRLPDLLPGRLPGRGGLANRQDRPGDGDELRAQGRSGKC